VSLATCEYNMISNEECEDCDAGRIRVTPATVVDHIVPIADAPDRRLDWTNLRSMAKPCHDAYTARTPGWGRAK
jgi:5-methylcytosine-specific restriction enzyme A